MVGTVVAGRHFRELWSRTVEICGNRDADGSPGTVVGRGPTRGYDFVPKTRVVDPKLREDLDMVGRRVYTSRRQSYN